MHERFRMILDKIPQIFMLIQMVKKVFENSHFSGTYSMSKIRLFFTDFSALEGYSNVGDIVMLVT